MKIIKTVTIAGIITLSHTSVFAQTAPDTSVTEANKEHKVAEHESHADNIPTLKEAAYHPPETAETRVNKVVIKPLDTLVAKDASSNDHNHFLYQINKQANTKTKLYRPSTPKSEGMPNHFKK